MLKSFKSYITEKLNEYGDAYGHNHDEESEYEGLSEIVSHMLHNKGMDHSIIRHILGNTRHLNEEDEQQPTKKESVKEAIGSALGRFKESYGREIGKPLKAGDITEAGRRAVEDHYTRRPDETPSQHADRQHKELTAAASRIGHVAYNDRNMTPEAIGARLAGGNKKTDTVVNNKLVKFKKRLTTRVSSYGGAPASYRHYHNASMTEHTDAITCPHATDGCSKSRNVLINKAKDKLKKIGAGCLAMSGGYGFSNTQKKVQINSHLRNANGSVQDHAILAAHHFKTQAEKASATDSVHSVRGQTTDQRGSDITAIGDETAKFHPVVKKHSVLFGYSKNTKEVLDAARKTKRGEGIPNIMAHSHPGPAYHEDANGDLHLNEKNINDIRKLRNAHETAEKEGLKINDYVVTGGHSLDENGNKLAKTIHRQPKSISAKAKPARIASHSEETTRFNRLDSSVKTMRHWDLHHSGELKDGEPESHHDPVTGKGHTTIVQDGKRLKVGYHDRSTNVGDTKTGHLSYEQRHDGRYADGENNKPSSHVTAGVSSTNNAAATGGYSNGLMHQMHVSFDMHGNKFRHSGAGILHDAHPDLMQKAGFKYERRKIDLNPE